MGITASRSIGQSRLRTYDQNNLTFIENLGRGSYGKVQLLFDKKSEECVAVKFIPIIGDKKIIKKRLVDANREAKIQFQLKHTNIVSVLGTTLKDNKFGIILEYVPYGNLESFLLYETKITISWKVRARFFSELANALDYLHYHDAKRSYIHGDLKPQNVLLGNGLTIKLADFGSASIAKATNATSLNFGKGSTQHTKYYSAPEFLKNPTSDNRQCSMDVYSYGMIGYEIITRKKVFFGNHVPYCVLIDSIMTRGQHPNTMYINEMKETLLPNSSDSTVFEKLENVLYSCWEMVPESRPKICHIKEELLILGQEQHIYDESSVNETKSLIERRNSNSISKRIEERIALVSREHNMSQALESGRSFFCKPIGLLAIAALLFGALIACLPQTQTINISSCFLILNQTEIIKYNRTNNTLIPLVRLPEPTKDHPEMPDLVVVNETIYAISAFRAKKHAKLFTIWRRNLANPYSIWIEIEWEFQYLSRKYIAFKDSIIAVGNKNFKMYMKRTGESFRLNSEPSDHAYLYNVTTNKWHVLPRMNENRNGHVLVEVNGLVCVVGGSVDGRPECYNSTTNLWSYLPPMLFKRKFPAVATLHGELYVMGGIDIDVGEVVEKYNPVTFKWTQVASMLNKRCLHTAGVISGTIYVLGGIGPQQNDVEAYDPRKNLWKKVHTFSKSYDAYLAVHN